MKNAKKSVENSTKNHERPSWYCQVSVIIILSISKFFCKKTRGKQRACSERLTDNEGQDVGHCQVGQVDIGGAPVTRHSFLMRANWNKRSFTSYTRYWGWQCMLRDYRELQQRGRYCRAQWEGWGSPDWPEGRLKGMKIFKGILFMYFVQRSNSKESTGHHSGNEDPCSGEILTEVLFNKSCDIILLVLRPGLVPEHCCHFHPDVLIN